MHFFFREGGVGVVVAAHDAVDIVVATHDAVDIVVAANDAVELANDSTKAVVLSLRDFSLYFSVKYCGFTKITQFR